MNEEATFRLLDAFALKIYELQAGLAAMLNLCESNGLFDRNEFLEEYKAVESLPDLRKWRNFLDALRDSKGQEDLEVLLRNYKGPVQ